MKSFHSPKFWITLLSLLLLSALPTCAKPLSSLNEGPQSALTAAEAFNVPQQQTESPQAVLRKLAQADVVYLGEVHDRPADHAAQLAILQALYRQRPKLIIGMEMFQRPFQPALDRYLAGALSEAELVAQTEYEQRWGFPWEWYAPVLRFALAEKLPVVALNTPREVTRKVARQGLESLTPEEQRFIPPIATIEIGPAAYRQRLQRFFDDMHRGKSQSMQFERFFQAQVLWDETMAERIDDLRQTYPDHLIVVLVGKGHLLFGDGIPRRVARRAQARNQPLQQVNVLLNPEPSLRSPTTPPIADYFWYSSPPPSSGNK